MRSQRAALRAARLFIFGAAAGAAALAAALIGAQPVAAHGELILQLGAERVQPGGSVEVRGDLGAGESFEVALIAKADGSRRVITTIPATEEGHFQTYVTIPTDVPTGEYLLEVAVDVVVVRAPLTVAGGPVGGDGGAQPEQEEGLIAPLPSGFGVAAGAASLQPAGTATEPVANQSGRSLIDGVLVVAVALGAAIALVVGMRLTGRRRSAS